MLKKHSSVKYLLVILSLFILIGNSAWAQNEAPRRITLASNALILPITGVTPEEARSIAAFITMTFAPYSDDQSRNASLIPAGGRPWGIGVGARDVILKLINQFKAPSAIGVNVVPSGTGKIATIRRFDKTGILTEIMDIQYSDPFEFWIKLQQPASTTRRADGGKVWVVYRQGVNRAETEELMQFWFADLVSMGSQGLKELDDQTAGFEAAMKILESQNTGDFSVNWMSTIDDMVKYYKDSKIVPSSSKPWYRATAGTLFNTRYLDLILKSIPDGYANSKPDLIFNISRQGARTRIEVVRTTDNTNGAYVTEYDSAPGFRRVLRSNSLRLIDALYREPIEYARNDGVRSAWVTRSDLTELKTNVPVPNTFIQVKRPAASAGDVSRSGFYMTRNLITQREFETVMGSNPSRHKGANLPVHNVTYVEAMEYCNRLSLRDGLMPAYDYFFWEGDKKEEKYDIGYLGTRKYFNLPVTVYNGQEINIRVNEYANGYRLPTSEEWEFVRTGGRTVISIVNNRRVDTSPFSIAQLFNSKEMEKYGWFQSNSNGRVQPVGQKLPINGFYDLLGNVMEFTHDSSTKIDSYGNSRTTTVRGGDYQTQYNYNYLDYHREKDGSELRRNLSGISLMTAAIGVNVREGIYQPGMPNIPGATKIPLTAGFRIVRPMFDYWAYRSAGTGAAATAAPAANIAAEDPNVLEAEKRQAVAKTLQRAAAWQESLRNTAIIDARQRYAARKDDPNYRETALRMEHKDGTVVAVAGLQVFQDNKPVTRTTGSGNRAAAENIELKEIEFYDNYMVFFFNSFNRFLERPQNILLVNMETQEVHNPSHFSVGGGKNQKTVSALVFSGVSGTRFTLISANIDPVYYVDEIYIIDASRREQMNVPKDVFIAGKNYYYFRPRIPMTQEGKGDIAYLDFISISCNRRGNGSAFFVLYFTKTPDTPFSSSSNWVTEIFYDSERHVLIKNLDTGFEIKNDSYQFNFLNDTLKNMEGNRFSLTIDYKSDDAKTRPKDWKPMIVEEFDLRDAIVEKAK